MRSVTELRSGSAFGDARHRWALLAAAVACAMATLAGDTVRQALRYERAALADGQWWRLLSAHLTHLDLQHLLFNLLGLALLWLLYARNYTLWRWGVIALASALGIDAGLWWGQPQVYWYVGASGVLHGVWTAGAYAELVRRDWLGAASLALLAAKLIAEQLTHGSLILGDLPVVSIAHVYGAIAGLLSALVLQAAAGSRRVPL